MSSGADRRAQILSAAARLFATHGFHGVSIADLGASCGISGPALYKHFGGKDEILAALLIDVSDELLHEAAARIDTADTPEAALDALLAWHVDFAIAHRELIIIQDRDWQSLPAEHSSRVRSVQREYVDAWAQQIALVRRPHGEILDPAAARAVAHAIFGLLNSTPRGRGLDAETQRELLITLGRRALGLQEGGLTR